MRHRPVTPERLAAEIAEAAHAAAPRGWTRVLVDGADAAEPRVLADAVADVLRAAGRAVVRVSAADYLRPASLRFEHGRDDPDSYYLDWLDEGALRREVLAPLDDGGSGLVLPRLWNAAADRSWRDERVAVPRPGSVVVDGALLLGRGLPCEVAAHLDVSHAALRRRTPPDAAWTLPAFDRYADEVRPADVADVVVGWDHPRRPVVITR